MTEWFQSVHVLNTENKFAVCEYKYGFIISHHCCLYGIVTVVY
jgi:hypothetical protein